jgi:hypothetical protein
VVVAKTAEERSTLLDWVEKAALENIKAQIQAGDELKKEANVALNVLLAGAAGALAYASHSFETNSALVGWAALGLSISLFALCAIDLRYCLWISDFPAPTNEPKQLLLKDADFESLRVDELNHMQMRIEEAQARNETRAAWLNVIRGAALFTPLIPALVLLFLRWVRVS